MDEAEYTFHPNARDKIDRLAQSLLIKVKSVQVTASKPSLPRDVPISAHLSDADILDIPSIGAADIFGEWIWRGFLHDNALYGLANSDYEELLQLADEILKVKWAKKFFGKKSIEEAIFVWCRQQFRSETPVLLSGFICKAAVESIQLHEILVPIAHLTIETDFNFGPVRILSVFKEFLDRQEELASAGADPLTQENVRKFYNDLRSKIQGRAAVSANITAVADYAHEVAIQLASTAVALLRMFSTAAYSPWAVCPCAIKGSEFIPQTMSFVSRDGNSFHHQEKLSPNGVVFWNLVDAELNVIRQSGLDNLGVLIYSDTLNPFQTRARAALLAYSNGLVLPDVNERLVHSLSAMETLLLGGSAAPIQQTLADRIAFLVTNDPATRRAIADNVRAVYSMRSNYIHHRVSSIEKHQLETFVDHSRTVLQVAINGLQTFKTPEDFINAIDTIKYGDKIRFRGSVHARNAAPSCVSSQRLRERPPP